MDGAKTPNVEDSRLVAAARAGDQRAFASLTEGYRSELQVHCYRMLGSLEDAQDLVQDALLRAWTRRESFEGRSTFRAWLYRIATNACIDFLERSKRRLPHRDAGTSLPLDLPWLQPYPDHLLEELASNDEDPGARIVMKETIELAYLVALQVLSPSQRAALILCDVLDWSAREVAVLLDTTVPSGERRLAARPRHPEEVWPRTRARVEAGGGPRSPGAGALAAVRRSRRAGRRCGPCRLVSRGRAVRHAPGGRGLGWP